MGILYLNEIGILIKRMEADSNLDRDSRFLGVDYSLFRPSCHIDRMITVYLFVRAITTR
jgi:hypothetical protein